ncbi:MAG TPA: thiamine pyrophosphate-binding protein [Polyangia bacterium]|nr:thiamine pyrophosphate-binding protein [Polyangia bacterium]
MAQQVMIGGQLIARALKNEGVRAVFTLCGGHVMPIYLGCHGEGLDIIDNRHEQGAVHAADAYARLTRGVGVAVITAGPGVTDGVTGVANAYQASVPMLVLGGAAELRFIGKGALQEMEQTSLLRPITKWSATITQAERIPEMIAAACRIATTGVPGPVFLEVPFDVLTRQVADAYFPTSYKPTSRTQLDPESIEAAARLIGAAERPIVFAGSQIWWDDAAGVLRTLADRHGIPVYLNAMGRGALPPTHPTAFSLSRKIAFRKTDCVLVVGTPLDFRVGYGAAINLPAKIIQIDRDPSKIGQNRPVAIGMVGDARSNLEALDQALPRGTGTRFAGWVEELRADEAKRRAEQEKWEKDDSRPINHYRFGRAIADAIDDDTILIGDGGDIVAIAAKVIPLFAPGRWLDPGPLGCLGVGAPFALAAKYLHPKKKVLVISGDGSFGLNGFDFESCIRQKLPVVCIVGNDAGWGQIRGPQVMLMGPDLAPATRLAPTRYDRVVEAFGGRGEQVEDPRAIAPALRRAFESDETYCINVPIDPDFMIKTGASKLSV